MPRVNSIYRNVVAPVPRYLMRLNCIEALLQAHVHDINDFLEIGPGMGDVSAYLLKKHPKAKAQLLEFSERAAMQLQQRFRDESRASVQTHDLLQDTRAASFDLILAFEVLEHIEHDLLALERIHRSLRPGGFFLLSVPAFMNKWEAGDDWAGHFRRYEKDELRTKLHGCGFEICALWSYGFPITAMLYPLRQVYYRRQLKHAQPQDKTEASKQSGITRPLHAPAWSPWLAHAMQPLFLLQHLARNSSLGDGWIVMAQKPHIACP
ncbi:MAG: class I SAM-dependent methyltransferase [Kiritimatiellia bacterium]